MGPMIGSKDRIVHREPRHRSRQNLPFCNPQSVGQAVLSKWSYLSPWWGAFFYPHPHSPLSFHFAVAKQTVAAALRSSPPTKYPPSYARDSPWTSQNNTEENFMNHDHIPKNLPRQEPDSTDPTTLSQKIQARIFYRIWHILGDKNANPPIPPIIPISRSSFYAGIKEGKFPAPLRISARVSAWRGEDILKLLEALGREVK